MTARPVILCGGDMTRLAPRDDCPNPLHDYPLPAGYVDAAEEAGSRLSRGWTNKRCPSCRRYGWEPGRPRTGEQLVRTPYIPEEQP